MAAFAMAASLAAGYSTSAAAQSVEPNGLRADPFSALVGKRKPAADRARASGAVERFIVATDNRVFLFQTDKRAGRLKFICGDNDPRIDCAIDRDNPAEEIHILNPTRISRGDVAWRNDEGETLVRVAAYGGVTVYWPGELRGQAASKSFGEDPALVLPGADLNAARARAQRATAIISAKVGAPILFEISPSPIVVAALPEATAAPAADFAAPIRALSAEAELADQSGDIGASANETRQREEFGDASVLADAIVRAAKGVSAVADDPTGARVISTRLERVVFRIERPPGLRFDGKALIIGYDPDLDVEGRPSSARIVRFLEESL